MLIIKAYVNKDQIDEVWVQNVRDYPNGICGYLIAKPVIEHKQRIIKHKRSDGWMVLMEKVLRELNKKNV